MKYENLVWSNTIFEYKSPTQNLTKVSNLVASQLTVVYIYIIHAYTSAVNKTVNYPGDLPRGRETNDKSDCSNGISIRGRLYYMYTVYIPCGALGCTLVISAGSRATSARGLEGVGVGRIHPPQIDWNCSLADISFLMVRGSFR